MSLETLSDEKQQLIGSLVKDLRLVDNVQAIVLGGSVAEGTATPLSDIDLGIYYSPKKPFDIKSIAAVFQKYEKSKTLFTDFYGWGPWANGGAWALTSQGQVDVIYRNIEQVEDIIQKAHEGIWENDFEQQPPYGFSSLIYLAETSICIPLYDPEAQIAKLKAKVEIYPLKLKNNVVQQSLWNSEFTIWQAKRFLKTNDIYNIAGCLTRSLKSLTTALLALNEVYSIGDKRIIERITSAKLRPENFAERVEDILSTKKESLPLNIDKLVSLQKDVVKLAGDLYQPYFQLKD